jgi:hypothetical protein
MPLIRCFTVRGFICLYPSAGGGQYDSTMYGLILRVSLVRLKARLMELFILKNGTMCGIRGNCQRLTVTQQAQAATTVPLEDDRKTGEVGAP